MKKFLTMLLLVGCCYLISCNSKSDSGLSPTAQKNLDASHAISQMFTTKDFSKLGDYIATDAVDHAGENGDIKGLDSIKASLIKEVNSMDDVKSETIKDLADDEYVMSWEDFSGTYKEAGMGHKAGDKMNFKAIEVSKFKDGKAVEHWTMMEPGDVMKMMASMQPPGTMPMPAMDSTKKATKK
jgi:predicted ester cyclase